MAVATNILLAGLFAAAILCALMLLQIRDDQRELIDLLTGRKPPAKAAPRTNKPAMPDGISVTTDEALPNLISVKRPRFTLRQFQRASERLAVAK